MVNLVAVPYGALYIGMYCTEIKIQTVNKVLRHQMMAISPWGDFS